MSLAGKRVLVLEDEPIVVMLVETIVEDAGAVLVGPASTVKEALELIERSQIDVGFLDVNVNGEPSYAVATRLQGLNIPFVFATGYGDRGFNRESGHRMILKPYRAEQVTGALMDAMTIRQGA